MNAKSLRQLLSEILRIDPRVVDDASPDGTGGLGQPSISTTGSLGNAHGQTRFGGRLHYDPQVFEGNAGIGTRCSVCDRILLRLGAAARLLGACRSD